MALGIAPGDHVLDLCAAPGAKLCLLLDLLCDSGSVTGVDVARHCLAPCRTMVQKYSIGEFAVESRYKEWSSRKPWKGKKQAAKARQGSSMLSASAISEPELIFYGQHSGVVSCTKEEIYRIASSNETCNCGYDKSALMMGQLGMSRSLKIGDGKHFGAAFSMPRELMI